MCMMEDASEFCQGVDYLIAGDSNIEDQTDQCTGIETDSNGSGNLSTEANIDEKRRTLYGQQGSHLPDIRMPLGTSSEEKGE